MELRAPLRNVLPNGLITMNAEPQDMSTLESDASQVCEMSTTTISIIIRRTHKHTKQEGVGTIGILCIVSVLSHVDQEMSV